MKMVDTKLKEKKRKEQKQMEDEAKRRKDMKSTRENNETKSKQN